ncbi:hypothetical protein [Moritella viscosa]|uniref:Uncharacterized protein RP511 n=1 Tax=Moritella viscosa TaxID=80854 RepID=A0ABY1HJL3_9GAMM|nr:hypothetical protein [Moritella viscosa]SGZ01930.1 Uncharacterized protein RP511 [Moritella viscosa]SGZ15386.1 Uncharacterized protein RP511 [Moritella viscosa]SHO28649.1 Uncharacterized protein RP511 [Moritella viscosa]
MFNILVKFKDSGHVCEYQSELQLPVGLGLSLRTKHGEGFCTVTENKEKVEVVDTSKNIMTRWITSYSVITNSSCLGISDELQKEIFENYRKWSELNLHSQVEYQKRKDSGCLGEVDCYCAYCSTDY